MSKKEGYKGTVNRNNAGGKNTTARNMSTPSDKANVNRGGVDFKVSFETVKK